MKRLFVLLSTVFLLMGAQEAMAQSRTVTGRVTAAATGQPLPGITVTVKGSTIGTQTNAEGRYSLSVPANATTLVFSSIAYGMTELPITGNTVDAQLTPKAIALQGVVVTGLGIKRQEAAVGTATQQVDGDELSRVEPNFVNTLSGKVAGVNITNAGAPGSSSRIVIRGASSITGNNQPLFVIDGVPIDNYSSSVGSGGHDWGNAAMDINPADVASITVLKGPNAAALYGSRAANGAIIITTKSGIGAKGGRITASQYVSFEDPLRLPDFQNAYGQGQLGLFEFVDGNGGGVYDDYDESWGPPLDKGLKIAQFDSPIDPATGERIPTPWVSHPDNIRHFFETGRTLTTNASFATATDKTNLRLSLSRLNQDGMLPGFKMGRTNVGLSGGIDFTDRLRATTSIEYINTDGANRPGIGYGETNPVEQFIWFGRQVDMREMEAWYDQVNPANDPNAGLPISWNYSFHPNPYYLQLADGNSQSRNRIIGNVQMSYQFTPWLSGSVFSGTDWYQQDRKVTYAQNTWGIGVGATGAFSNDQMNFQETNSRFLLSANPNMSGPFSVKVDFGGNRRDYSRVTDGVSVNELITPGIYSVNNAKSIPNSSDYTSRKRVNSLFGQAELGYNEYLYLTLTGRNDWSSTLPEDNNSYFYPSVSGSFIFTDAIPAFQNSSVLSFGKLRASWARVGNDADPYQLATTIAASSLFGSLPTYAVANQIANADLRPESTESWEFGGELGFFRDRMGLDFTYYTKTTSDQIFPVQISRATGFTSRVVNAGAVRNRGVELLLRGTPIQSDNGFRWNTTVTFGKNNNEVVSLTDGVTGIELGGLWGANIWARAGEPYGQIVSSGFARDSQGRIIVNSRGLPMAADTLMVLGNYNPDWTGGWANDFGYKGLNLHVLLDTKQGGQIFSATDLWGRYAGVLQSTVAGRCWLPGYPSDSKETLPPCLDESGNNVNGIVVDGVMVNAAGDTVQNTIVTNAYRYNKALYGKNEAHIYDASFVKLREVTLTYDVPSRFADRVGVSGVQLGLIGRNLALWTKNPNIDPETAYDASNAQGFEFGQLPTARSIGFNITITP